MAVLSKIKPKKEEKEKLFSEAAKIIALVQSTLQKNNIQCQVELSGSTSRDTWLAGNHDIDVFIILPSTSKLMPEEINALLKKEINLPWVIKYAQHPYLHSKTNGYELDIVPCYAYKETKNLRSAVDRTPSHVEFIKKNLKAGSSDEVRLLKQFMIGIGTYGADIKVQGFSGYLLELLIINFNGQFLELIKKAHILPNKVITFKKDLVVNTKKFEGESLIVIDPTDANRNVASAVTKQALAEFIAASKQYLLNPSEKFFFPRKIAITDTIFQEMRDSPLHLTAFIQPKPSLIDETLWGQLRRFERSLLDYLGIQYMQPISISSIIYNAFIFTFILTISNTTLKYSWRTGPPVDNLSQEQYLKKYCTNDSIIFGPAIKDERWTVLLETKEMTIVPLIKNALKEKLVVTPSHFQSIDKCTFFTKNEFLLKYQEDTELVQFVYKMIKGKPNYLL